jgi:hypothetical protein
MVPARFWTFGSLETRAYMLSMRAGTDTWNVCARRYSTGLEKKWNRTYIWLFVDGQCLQYDTTARAVLDHAIGLLVDVLEW